MMKRRKLLLIHIIGLTIVCGASLIWMPFEPMFVIYLFGVGWMLFVFSVIPERLINGGNE